jgi:hypothetical protein
MMNNKLSPRKLISAFTVAALLTACSETQDRATESLETLAAQFAAPPDRYKPQAYWFWLGSNFSKEGMTLDLEAMKAAGIGGVVVFNAPSWLDTLRNPHRDQRYRSPKYWDAFGHALSEARRLGMIVGIHNAPGWSVTGGPWISPDDGMKAVAYSKTAVSGRSGQMARIALPNPKAATVAAPYFRDVAVIAAPAGRDSLTETDLIDLSSAIDDDGNLEWATPEGEWTVYRIGYCPTFRHTHPTPEDVQEASLEVDKMDRAATERHWQNVIAPYVEKFGEYIGNTFYHLWIDSYEAGEQNWSPTFRDDFRRLKNYDPVPQLVLADLAGVNIFNRDSTGFRLRDNVGDTATRRFAADCIDVARTLFMECFALGRALVNRAGFQLSWEPYSSVGATPFDVAAGVAVADIPVTEFWVHSRDVAEGDLIAYAAAEAGKHIVAAEAFTGMEATCRFNETPAMLKRPADMGFNYGVNRYFVHAWAHNPLPDKYRPGFTFAHYGTHFTRHQTWFEPGKAFFAYLARCQMLLQQGRFVERNDEVLHRATPDADIYFVRNTGDATEKRIVVPATGVEPEVWDAYRAEIRTPDNCLTTGDSTTVALQMTRNESLFVVVPRQRTHYAKRRTVAVVQIAADTLRNVWQVRFVPATDEQPFERRLDTLIDWSRQSSPEIRYFSGTAHYETTVAVAAADLAADRRVTLDLGAVADLAVVAVNGTPCDTLWYPPFTADITDALHTGENQLQISVTNTWVNRLIGDEQYPEDFDWEVRAQNGQRAMKALPDWALNDAPRPVPQRKTFTPWYFYDKNADLLPAGLLGDVRLVKSAVK